MIDDTSTDVGKMNDLLDKITERRFISPQIFHHSVFKVCELFGIHVPTEELNSEPGENIFNFDNNELYLYLVSELDDENNVYDCYAQLVTKDELDELQNEDALNKEYTDSIEDQEEKLRHQGTGRDVDETPPEE